MSSNALRQAIRLFVYKHRVSKTLDAGVLPLVLRYRQINACDSRLPVAYRTETVVRSTALGYLPPHEYQKACENTEKNLARARTRIDKRKIMEYNKGVIKPRRLL